MAKLFRFRSSDNTTAAANPKVKPRNAVHIRGAEGRAAPIEAQRAAMKVLTERYRNSRPNG